MDWFDPVGTDAADAEAICEVVALATMRFVPVKSAEQQAGARVSKTRDLVSTKWRSHALAKIMCGNRQ